MNKYTRRPDKFEFRINNKYVFSISMSHSIFGTYLYLLDLKPISPDSWFRVLSSLACSSSPGTLEKSELFRPSHLRERTNHEQLSHILKTCCRASLVAQWLRICLPMQGTWVRALVWEDPTCCGATKPVPHNY